MRPLFGYTALVSALAATALVRVRRRAPRRACAVVLIAMLALTPPVGLGLARVAAARSVAVLGTALSGGDATDAVLVHEGPIEASGALEWYSGRRPVLLDATRSVLGFGATYPEAAETFWDASRFLAEWRAGRRLLLVTPRPPEGSIVARIPAEHRRLVLATHGRRLYRIGCGEAEGCGSVGR
jgi:hypothetical protein